MLRLDKACKGRSIIVHEVSAHYTCVGNILADALANSSLDGFASANEYLHLQQHDLTSECEEEDDEYEDNDSNDGSADTWDGTCYDERLFDR